MVDRVGDWYAFSRSAFCRRLTLYEDLPWCSSSSSNNSGGAALTSMSEASSNDFAELPPTFSLATAEMVALAPFGGLIAVLGQSSDFAASPGAVDGVQMMSTSPGGSPRPLFNLSAHSAAATSSPTKALHLFTSAGELLATLPLTPQELPAHDTVTALGWTPEGEVYCFLEPPLTVLFVDTRDVAVAAVGASPTSLAPPRRAATVSRRVALRPVGATDVAANRDGAGASALRVSALCVSMEGLLCVEGSGSGQLYGLLHEEKFTSALVPSVRLPLSSSAALDATGQIEASGITAGQSTRRQHVTALDMVPPSWNDSGDFIVLWAQCDDAASEQRGSQRGIVEEPMTSTLCAMVLPDGDLIDYEDGNGDTVRGSTWPAARVLCPGRILSLSVCVTDPTQVAVFTSRGVLHVYRSNLSSALYTIDLGLCRVLRDLAMSAAEAAVTDGSVPYGNGNASGGELGGFASQSFALGTSFAFGEAPWRQRDTDAASNASSAGNAAGDVHFSPATSFRNSFYPDGASGHGNNSSLGGGKYGDGSNAMSWGNACPTPYKVEWCGATFVLVHFYQSDFQQFTSAHASYGAAATERQDAPMFSLLVCAQRGCSVHCERLDWSLDGSGHIATVAEADGVRVVTDTTCYFLQEVPTCLARLCRVQPPFSAAAQVVQAYQAYTNGDRHGIAQVRAALSSTSAADADAASAEMNADENNRNDNNDDDVADDVEDEELSHAEGIVYELLDCASHEFDVEQQYLLVAAASFAGETIHLRSGVPDVIVDVVRRLRVLRAVRQEADCHIPLTMGQYQALIGSEERPARLLSTSEGSVLVDRLAYLGYYQLALDVVRALRMRSHRVLSRWSCSFIRRHAGVWSDAAVHHEVTQVLQQHAGASYVEAATTAFQLGRRDLALRLLRDEPLQQRQRVMLCVQMGELAMAGRAAAASGSAELVHLVVCALVAKEAQARRARLAKKAEGKGGDTEERGGDENDDNVGEDEESDAEDGATFATADVTAGDVFHCLVASPELLCWLLVGAQCLASWQSMAQRLLFSSHWSLASLECQHMLVQCLRLSTPMHHAQLQRCMVETTVEPEVDEADSELMPDDKKKKDKKKKRRKHRRKRKNGSGSDDGGSGGDTGSDDDDADGAAGNQRGQGSVTDEKETSALTRPLPPPLAIPVPTALGAAAAFAEWLRKTRNVLLRGLQHTDELRGERSSSSARYPFSVVLERAEQLRSEARKAAAMQGGSSNNDDWTSSFASSDRSTVQRQRVNGQSTNNGAEDYDGPGSAAPSASSILLSHEHCVQTILTTPTSNPRKDIIALEKEEELSRLKVSLAVKHNTPHLSRIVSVVDLIRELSGLDDGDDDAAALQRTFKVGDRMFFYAQLRGMCAAQRWDAVDRLLGPAPPLRKRSFFSVSDKGGAKTPCVGYLPVVQMLTEYKQEERAARYVAGACAETVDRVVLYMSLGAPVMAMEAAMVDKDAGLIQQIMQRVPGSSKVQSVGKQLLSELQNE